MLPPEFGAKLRTRPAQKTPRPFNGGHPLKSTENTKARSVQGSGATFRLSLILIAKWLISIFWIFVTAACGVGLGVLLIPSDQYTVLRALMDTADLTLRQTMGLSLDRMVSLLVLYLGMSASAFMAVLYGAVSIGQLARSNRALASVGG